MLNRTISTFLLVLLGFTASKAQNTIQGTVFLDGNMSCTWDISEPLFRNWPIVAVSAGNAYWYAITDNFGNYEFNLPNNTYTIYPSPPFPGLYELLECIPYEITLNGNQELVDMPMNGLAPCAELYVEIAATELQADEVATLWLSYSNFGTKDIPNSKLTLGLDKTMTFIDASVFSDFDAIANLINLFGDFSPVGGELNNIRVDVLMNGGYDNGHPTSTNFYGFPQDVTPCDSVSGVWDQSTIVVEGECVQGDTAEFEIRNIGTGDMLASGGYTILQDDILGVATGSFQLNAGESQTVTIYGANNFHRIIVDQSPFHPTLDDPSSLVEICSITIGEESPGNAPLEVIDNNSTVLQREFNLVQDVAELSIFPSGVCPNRKILTDERLYFTLTVTNPFNTYVDSAIVGFQIPDELDPATFKMGLSTHDTRLILNSSLVLRWQFDSPIMANNPNNHYDQAIIKFSMMPRTTVQPGDDLNTEFGTTLNGMQFSSDDHLQYFTDDLTVCPPESSTDELTNTEELIYPNPANLSIQVRTSDKIERLTIVSVDGRIMISQTGSQNRLDVSALSNGVYVVSVETEEGIFRKKLLIQH